MKEGADQTAKTPAQMVCQKANSKDPDHGSYRSQIGLTGKKSENWQRQKGNEPALGRGDARVNDSRGPA